VHDVAARARLVVVVRPVPQAVATAVAVDVLLFWMPPGQ
jgi:hypothetical protein